MPTRGLIIKEVVEETTVDGPGFRTVIYAAGCTHHCKGCHNPETWELSAGHEEEIDALAEGLLDDPFSDITFSGGDPLFQVEGFTELAKTIKAKSSKNIWCFTGYLFEDVLKSKRLSAILPYIDVLVDGPFVEELKSKELLFRGSSNQRLIDVQASLASGMVTLVDDRIGI